MRHVLLLALLQQQQQPLAVAPVVVKILKDTNIGWGRGKGDEPAGTPVVGYPAVIFFGRVDSPSKCADACVADAKCTGFIHTVRRENAFCLRALFLVEKRWRTPGRLSRPAQDRTDRGKEN
jgi:hypothetical protein